MLLPLSYSYGYWFPPKPLTDQFPSSPPFFFSLPNPRPSPFLARSSIADTDTETLPKSAIQRIADKLRSLGITDENPAEIEPIDQTESAGEIFVPLPEQLPKYRVGHTLDSSWSTPDNQVHELKKQKQLEKGLWKKPREERAPTLAELSLSKGELRRLQGIGIALTAKLKIGKAGITEGIVNGIHERWRHSEVVKVVCEDFVRMNMKRTHDLLERKTGGLVVWRSGSKVVLYRGANYKYPYFFSDEVPTNATSHEALPNTCMDDKGNNKMESCSSDTVVAESAGPSQTNKTRSMLIHGVGSPNRVRFQLPGEAQLAEEADLLLEGLGPRYTDWWGYDPLPIDADLLPAVIPRYKRPFRLLPHGIQPKLTNDEMTTLRRLGRPLPCHFALGRNRKIQGLAASIVKLWEKCEIAKVAVKRGVPNTNSEMMAEELQQLTGGTLLSRDSEFIVLYRGKDFLPPAVSSAIVERRKHGVHRECDSEAELDKINAQKEVLSQQKKLRSSEDAIKKTSIKLSLAIEKKAKAEKLLAELEKTQISQPNEANKEPITEEERFMLRKIGLKMKPFLLLGRRGVFAGTVENMHLHWKYRELVKIISNEWSYEAVHQVAKVLEAESGGILVAVERVKRDFAIIVYRGKNYKRPSSLRPQTLLNKREAMKRSLEAQRSQSLKLHVLELTRNIDDLKVQSHKDEKSNIKLVDESNFQLVTEPISMQSGEHGGSDIKHKSGHFSDLVIPACQVENTVARDNHFANSTPSSLNDCLDASMSGLLTTQQDKMIDFSSTHSGIKSGNTESQFSSESISKETGANALTDMGGEGVYYESTSCPDNFVSEEISSYVMANPDNCISSNDPMKSSVEVRKNIAKLSAPAVVENGLNRIPLHRVSLSNKDRLLLRKQALKMKKRPVLAVGRSNIVTGVAKAIKAHFERHPLAIVNVKGRAKGTSVQELVSKLEQATGAVLVSQEPCKVILYRGWGAGDDDYTDTSKNNSRNIGKNSLGKEIGARPAVSPELLAAIRLECGLQFNKERDPTE